MFVKYLMTLLIPALFLFAGCRDDVKKGEAIDTEDSAASYEDTPVIDLSDEQMAAFCSEIFDATIDATDSLRTAVSAQICAIAGASAAESVADGGGSAEEIVSSCEVMVQTCEAGGTDGFMQLLQGMTSLETEGAFCVGIQDFFGDCDATTSEMSGCYLAMLASELTQYEQELATLPECSAYSPAFFEESNTPNNSMNLSDVPIACMTVAVKCPDMATSVLAFPGL